VVGVSLRLDLPGAPVTTSGVAVRRVGDAWHGRELQLVPVPAGAGARRGFSWRLVAALPDTRAAEVFAALAAPFEQGP